MPGVRKGSAQILAVFGEEDLAQGKVQAAANDIIDGTELDRVGLTAGGVVKLAPIVAVIAVGIRLPAREIVFFLVRAPSLVSAASRAHGVNSALGHASVPAGLAGVVEGAAAEPNCHAGALALVDNRHLKVPDEHIA